jgi:hypothetical protein
MKTSMMMNIAFVRTIATLTNSASRPAASQSERGVMEMTTPCLGVWGD